MANDNVEKIKERLDIVDLISGYLKVQKAGINYKANCPFHQEKTPSFFISPTRQIWRCFGCSRGGDHFSFVQEIEGVDFLEALQLLARRAGVELDGFNREEESQKTRLLDLTELATKFFEKQLWESQAGGETIGYLKNRGLTENSIKNFRLGLAPASWDGLVSFLQSRHYQPAEIIRAGLAILHPRQPERCYDRFRQRLIFPVASLNDQIVGFSGRTLENIVLAFSSPSDAQSSSVSAKYINTPQTILYDKSRVLYGLNRARLAIKKTDRCLVVEGNLDVVLSHQAGVEATVASSGTALTEQQLKIIGRYTRNLDLSFDQDAAGLAAMERGIGLALHHNFNVRAIILDDAECKDPADYVKKSASQWRQLTENPRPIFHFYFDLIKKNFDLSTALGKKLAAEKILPLIKNLASRVEQAHWLEELALHLKTKEEFLYEQMRETPSSLAGDKTKFVSGPNDFFTRATPVALEEYLLALLIIKPNLAKGADQPGFLEENYNYPVLPFCLRALAHFPTEDRVLHPIDYLVQVASRESFTALDRFYLEKLLLQGEIRWKDFSGQDLEQEWSVAWKQWRHQQITARLSDLEHSIREAEKESNQEKLLLLINQFQNWATKLRETDGSMN